MNEVIKTILSRRSVRSFTNEMVPKEMIEEIVNAGQYAPSAMNSQSPIILAITRKELIEKMSKLNAEVLGTANFDPFFGAPVLLVVLAERNAPSPVCDGSLVIGNMMLAATSLGLGSCWINRAEEVFDSLEGKSILRELGIEGDYVGIGNCILGFPNGDVPEAMPRKDHYVYYID